MYSVWPGRESLKYRHLLCYQQYVFCLIIKGWVSGFFLSETLEGVNGDYKQFDLKDMGSRLCENNDEIQQNLHLAMSDRRANVEEDGEEGSEETYILQLITHTVERI